MRRDLTWLSYLGRRLREGRDRRLALRDLRGIVATEREERKWQFPKLLEELQTAAVRGDEAKGLGAWGEIRDEFFGLAMTSRATWEALLNFRWFDEAEGLMSKAVKLHPRDPCCAEGFAMVAQRRGDFEAALERWAIVRKRFPHEAVGYSQPGACLGCIGRQQEAETILTRGMTKFPHDFICKLEYSRLAEAAKNWPEALRRWREMCDFSAWPR